MLERFTDEARDAITRAQGEARALRDDRIRPEHLLIALATTTGPAGAALGRAGLDRETLLARIAAGATPTGFDAEALAGLGIDLRAVRTAIDGTFGVGALDGRPPHPGSGRRHIRFEAAAKRSLVVAVTSAIARKDRRVTAADLLLGVLDVLAEPAVIGVDPTWVRDLLAQEIDRAA